MLTLTKPFGSYIWMSESDTKTQLEMWARKSNISNGVFPEIHNKLKKLGLCNNYKLTDKGREVLNG
jgi:hypothetical protein